MEEEREITLKQIEDALEEVWRECPVTEEILKDNIIRVYVTGEPWVLIMNKDAYEAEMNSAIRDVVLDKDKLESYYNASEN